MLLTDIERSDLDPLSELFEKLRSAVLQGRSLPTCRRHWSRFVRMRDGNRCVICHATELLTAHHICRKSFLVGAQLETGNGITLCQECHRDVHKGFNGKPNLYQPMDAQGGEKIETLTRLFGSLLCDARERGILNTDYYFLGNSTLRTFKMLQTIDPLTEFAGQPLEQAYEIWRQSPVALVSALLKANGFG